MTDDPPRPPAADPPGAALPDAALSHSQSLICPLSSAVDRLDLSAMFPKVQPVEVELGCGDSTFLAQYALLHPEHNFLGVERLLGRLRKLDRKGRRAGLTNLRGLRIEAFYCVQYLLPPGSVRAFHIYFPDPWPKRRHRPRRLINERFTEIARCALEPAGRIYLRTDDANYCEQMKAAFAASRAFRPVDTPPDLASLTTDFERDFSARGVQTLRLAYERTAAQCGVP